MKIWLDDDLDDPEKTKRHTPPGWVGVKTAHEAIDYLKTGNVTEISLDHDLGDEAIVGNGYQVARWIEEHVINDNFVPPIITIHSANPTGRRNIQFSIDKIERVLQSRGI